MRVLITGGAGFIGANFILYWIVNHPEDSIVNFDKLTYAGNLENLKDVEKNPNYSFVHGDIDLGTGDFHERLAGLNGYVGGDSCRRTSPTGVGSYSSGGSACPSWRRGVDVSSGRAATAKRRVAVAKPQIANGWLA